jgi:hypothetical protein
MKKISLLVLFLFFATKVFADTTNFSNNLYYGLTNNTDVSALQEFLTTQGDYSGPVSGNFFSLTLAGVKKFQLVNNLPQSGYFGILSRGVANNLLASEMSVPSQESGSVSTQTNTINQTNYSTNSAVTFAQYSENPAAYTGQNIIVEGMEDSFLPSGSNGGSNFIEVTNLFDLSQPKIMFEVNDHSTYTTIVNALQNKYYPFIRVYGTGVASQSFTMTSASQTITVSLPVVSVSRVDWCPDAVQSGSYNGTSLESDESCPSWTIIAPTSAVSTTASSQTFVTPTGMVINQNGNVVGTSNTSTQSTAVNNTTNQLTSEQIIAESYYITNHTCVGLTDQNQYGDCMGYALNH